jgi:hypothetical protein
MQFAGIGLEFVQTSLRRAGMYRTSLEDQISIFCAL